LLLHHLNNVITLSLLEKSESETGPDHKVYLWGEHLNLIITGGGINQSDAF